MDELVHLHHPVHGFLVRVLLRIELSQLQLQLLQLGGDGGEGHCQVGNGLRNGVDQRGFLVNGELVGLKPLDCVHVGLSQALGEVIFYFVHVQ